MTLSMIVGLTLILVGVANIIFLPVAVENMLRNIIHTYYLEKEEHFKRCGEVDNELRELYNREKVH
jgi:hypothetical protein